MLDAMFRQAYPLARRAAQVRATAAVLCGAVLLADRGDLEQEALMACWRALPRFDPKRASLRTFVERVVAARMISLHRSRHCRPRFEPLDHQHHPVVGNSWAKGIELRSDVYRVLGTLQDGERRLALTLTAHSPTEAGRLLGIARSTVYEGMRRLRVRFEDAGFGPSRPGVGRKTRLP